MRVPTWALWLGILMIVMATCSGIQDINTFFVDDILSGEMDIHGGSTELDSTKTYTQEELEEIARKDSVTRAELEEVKQIIDTSPYLQEWMRTFAFAGLVVNVIYLIAGILMFVRRRFSPKLALGALILSIGFALFQVVIYRMDETDGIMAAALGVAPLFGVIADVVLIIILATSDKSYYTDPNYGRG